MIAEITQTLYHEAHLLDSGLFREWLALLAVDVHYWAPTRAEMNRDNDSPDEANRLPLFNETKQSLTLRIHRMETGIAWIETPPSRTRRFISNVMLLDTDSTNLFKVRSNFMIFKSRSYIDETIFVGCREDKWCNAGRWQLKERKILIDHCTLENLAVLI